MSKAERPHEFSAAQFGGIGAYNNRGGRRIIMGSNRNHNPEVAPCFHIAA